MSNGRRAAIKKLRAFYLSPKTDINDFRSKINETFSNVFLPNNVDWEEDVLRGTKYDILSPEMFSSNRILLYVHGGSFVAGSRLAYRPLVASLANITASKAYLPEFRLAPAHPFPASVEDVKIVFQEAFNKTEQMSGGESPEVIIAADTSGASIALSFLYGLSGKIRESVRQVILFSPWLDFSEENEIFKSKKCSDDIFTSESIRLCTEHYTYSENWKNPLVSPVLATDEMLAGFPPVFIQMGEKEIYYKTALKFKALLEKNGSSCEIDVWPKMPPLFQLADEELSESHLAIEKVGKLITAKDHTLESVREIQLVLEKN